MAELAQPLAPSWSAAQTRDQFLAVAWLRWRMLLNGFRRKGGTGELVGRILLIPILAGMAFGPSVLAGIGGFYFTQTGAMGNFVWMLWVIFGFSQLLNIQLGQPGSTFDPTELIRFPLTGRTYVFMRLCFGLLSPANVIATLMSGTLALGIVAAAPQLWLYAIVALAVFAATNVLFSRMVFAWVDRWLSTRRAREVFTGLIFAFSLGIQWLNFTFNPAYGGHGHHNSRAVAERFQYAVGLYAHVAPFLSWLPPQLIANALASAVRSAPLAYAGLILACAVYAVVFFLVFAARMRVEFRGENLSDAANVVAKPASAKAPAIAKTTPSAASHERTFGLPPALATLLGKEFLYLRRHTGMLYGIIMPIFLVLVLASRFASHGNAAWIFPAAVAYTLLAISPLSYNSFGFDATGVQFYFLAPVRMRDVLLAKNLLGFLLAAAEIAATFGIISYVAGVPQLNYAAATVLWAAGALLLNTAMGNRRSITAPKKVNPQRMANKQVSQLSALIGVGILLLCVTLAAVAGGAALFFGYGWALVPFFALFFAFALFLYERSLRGIDRFALENREQIFEELCKAG